ncbi:MAG TPA: acyl-CoA dehydrogenase family protein [Caulobacteraceae bacterium]|nr:acyl-CoA dehydrogenase family protein [Caulobacteraceae bacterium]
MNFALDDDHRQLKDSAQTFLDEQISLKSLLTPGATVQDAGYADNWAKIAGMGWQGLLIPEEYGGAGLSCLDLVMIVEELGRTLAPSPFLGSLLGTLAVIGGGDARQKERILPAVAAGELTLALALAETGGREEGPDKARATAEGGAWRITGEKAFVLDAAEAQTLVVAAADEGGGRRFFLVEASQSQVRVAIQPWRDITRQVCTVTLDGALAEPLARDPGEVWPWVRDRALLALSAENAAGLRHVLDVTCDYARERVAFGRPIGAYQAIKHALADMLGQAECARTAVLYAAWALSQEDVRAPMAAAMAKAYSSDAYVETAHRSIQIFGAIGFTWEMSNHLYLKRARGNAELFGAAREHRERVIDLARAELA